LKQRLDLALVERGLCESRTQSQRAIMAGLVTVNERRAAKAGDMVSSEDVLGLLAREKYVSRGGHKLEHALVHFSANVSGATALDIGASTGGFTDCLLQHGAAMVYAVDVGQGQLAWKLRTDPRVVVMERTNARQLSPAVFGSVGPIFDWVVADCSFISLRLILPASASVLKPRGTMIALVKPQFEAGKAEVDKGEGVIRDPLIHSRVLAELEAFVGVAGLGLVWRDVVASPLLGPAGNKEYLALLEKRP
jgi:23S rRNA (cytidine1920-2'-O)/16S rRNA (cytidine1409-2'-O)-methyltransferase